MKSVNHLSQVWVLFLALFLNACQSNGEKNNINSIKDPLEIRLGDFIMMASNYDGAFFRNGDSIPEAKSAEEWLRAGENQTPAWSYFNNDRHAGKKYGKIYNWYAINDPRGFSPVGWHVPSNEEWIQLERYIISDSLIYSLLGGYRSKEGIFTGMDEFTYLFSSSERDSIQNDIWGRGLHRDNATMMRCGMYKGHGLYVRLIKDL
ncbi:FISUMP domain-containing protein [Flavihumibacter sp. UBA7668]|uniref:FISUMP domain-containing protein n=1 Tax=Flavihumibacter sp. UBA7668 TaxID=1946542 RepID=UPI0025B9763F|nr:FISUMP domain-containing protein [Flavihumibacter sp. UBA7668]